MDESGVEPKTSPMLRERATNYATRPYLLEFYQLGDAIFHIIVHTHAKNDSESIARIDDRYVKKETTS